MRALLVIGLLALTTMLGACQALGPGLSPDALAARHNTGGYAASEYHSITPELP